MSERPPGSPLDENLSRLLRTTTEQPQLPAAAEERILAALTAQQAELYPGKGSDTMATSTLSDKRAGLSGRETSVIAAALIGLAVVALLALRVFTPPTPNQVAAPVVEQEPKTVAAESDQRETLADGTVVIARRGARYSIDALRQMTLSAGDLYLIVAPAEQPFVVATAEGTVIAHGTRFAVSAAADAGQGSTSAAVAQGRVELAGKAGRIELRAGQQGTLTADKRPVRRPAPRLSYLVNWARDQLAQEVPLVEQAEKQSGLIALDPSGQEVRLTLRKYVVDVYIEDGIARTTIDQTYFNHNPWNTEGTFYFPLPPDASVSRLAMYVSGDLNEGGMVERAFGQHVYNDIRYQWKDPALLEMMEGNVFKMRIFPLEGRQEKRVFLSYTQTLEELYGTLRYWFPMDHTHSTAKQLSIRVRLKDGADRFEPQSGTHAFQSVREGNDLVLTYSAEKARPDQDLLLSLLPVEELAEARISTTEKEGELFTFARLTPSFTGKADHQPRQWIVLNDRSASRTRIEAAAQQHIIERLVQEADDEDTIAVVDLNTRATLRTQGFVSAKKARRQRLSQTKNSAANRQLLGATNIEAGLRQAATLIKQTAAPNPHVLYLGDGVATDGVTDVTALVREIPGGATFVGVGVGKKVEARFLQAAADATGGMFAVINPDEDLDWRTFDLLAALNTARLTGLEVSLLAHGREPADLIAYPNSRVLSDGETLQVVARTTGELPTTMIVRGKLAGQDWQQTYDLRQAEQNAEYIPRLWAKRHLDELLKSGDEFKDQIVALSKQYYVVTPLTSLIVLENDAMYEQYQVERGRKDHWALYPAPQQIEVVKEPVEWRRWGWWGGGFEGDDARIESTSKPETVQEIVESVQFRINAPFYYWQPQSQQGQGRHLLYALTDSQADPSKLLTYLYLMASGEALPASKQAGGEAGDVAADSAIAGSHSEKLRREIGQSLQGFMLLPQAASASSRPEPLTMFWPDVRRRYGGGWRFDDSYFFDLETTRGEALYSYLPPRVTLFNGGQEFDFYERAPSVNYVVSDFALGQTPLPLIVAEDRKSLQPMLTIMLPFSRESLTLDSGIAPPLMQSYREAINGRWQRIEGDIRSFNQMYGQWDNSGWNNQWNELDLRRSGSARWYGGLEGMLGGEAGASLPSLLGLMTESEEMLPPIALRGPAARTSGFIAPMTRFARLGSTRSGPPAAQMAIYSQTLSALPGTCAVLAVDHLVPRRAELRKAGDDKQQERKLTELAIDSVGKAAARLEQTGPFWSWQGWEYKPQPAQAQLPQVQAYPNYNWSFDLTRYAEGLYSSKADVLNEIAQQYGTAPPQGKVADEARRQIEQARAAIKAVRIRFGEDGPEVLAAAGDRFAMNRRTDMYLHEQFVCDGEQLLHSYPELGLVARREATPLRLAALRDLVPQFIQPAETLAARFDVALGATDKIGFTLRLTPLGRTDDQAERIEMLINVSPQGLIRQKTLLVDGEQQFLLKYLYEGEQVKLQWLDKEEKLVSETSFTALPVAEAELAEHPFAIDLSDQVVIEMPLRRPSYYADQLAAAEGKLTTEEWVNLKRHFALSSIQQLQWRRWGQTNPEAEQALTEAIAMMDSEGHKVLLGDITLVGSAGVQNMTLVDDRTEVPQTHPVLRYLKQRSSSWHEAIKLRDEHPDTLSGHLAGYFAATQNADSLGAFIEKFEESPLLLAAAHFAGSWGNDPGPMLRLLDHPRWRGLAILLTSTKLTTAEQRTQWAEAFQAWHEELLAAGYDMPIPQQLVAPLKEYQSGKLWREVIESKWETAKKQEAVGPLLALAEQAMVWDENVLADKAMALAMTRLGGDLSLTSRLAIAQAYWAGGRTGEAHKLYEEILSKLKQKKVTASPALLASTARLAQQAGDLGRAIGLEEQALAAEHPYLPEMINLQAFQQRYNWLWQQYQAKVEEAVARNDEAAVKEWLARAERSWQQWFEVDHQNPSMIQQMATLQATAGRDQEAWLYLSTLVDQQPKDANSYYHVGQWYLGRGQADLAQRYYATAYTWDTANPRWLVERAAVLQGMQLRLQAKQLYQQVVEGDWAPGLQGYVNQAQQALQHNDLLRATEDE